MARTPDRIAPTWATLAGVDVFTVPAGERWTIAAILASNTDAVQRALALHHVPDAGAVSDENKTFPDCPIKAQMVVELGRGYVFTAGDKLHAAADADNKVNVTVYFERETLS